MKDGIATTIIGQVNATLATLPATKEVPVESQLRKVSVGSRRGRSLWSSRGAMIAERMSGEWAQGSDRCGILFHSVLRVIAITARAAAAEARLDITITAGPKGESP